jgi:hypothetical protein
MLHSAPKHRGHPRGVGYEPPPYEDAVLIAPHRQGGACIKTGCLAARYLLSGARPSNWAPLEGFYF